MASSSPAYSNWAYLPTELLDLILDKLVRLSDYIRFSSVCKPWLLVAQDQRKKRIKSCNKQLPMLMIPTEDSSKERRSLYNVITGKTLNFQLQVPYNRRCCGSSHGWLFFIENVTLILFNPFSGTTISLPPFTINSEDMFEWFGQEYGVAKVILSTDPCLASDDYEVVVIMYSELKRLAVFKAGAKAWTYAAKNDLLAYNDVIYHKGHILAVTNFCWIVEVISSTSTLSPQYLNLKRISIETATCCRMQEYSPTELGSYLVETSKGDLLMVRRFFNSELYFEDVDEDEDEEKPCITSTFEIFKLEYSYSEGKLNMSGEVKDLGGDTLFLGDNHCISVSASDYPGCRPNSIYYTHVINDNYLLPVPPPFGPIDMGIFNLEDGSFGEHYVSNPTQDHMPFPIWILPTLQNKVV